MKILMRLVVIALTFVSVHTAYAAPPTVVFGPQVFQRERGGPDVFRAAFRACDPKGSFRVVVDNGANGKGVSSGSIALNGMRVVGPNDFSQKVERIERPIIGVREDNEVEVELASAPGASITVTVEGVMNCLEVRLKSPADGAVVGGYDAVFSGEIDAPDGAEVGVTVNGVTAEVSGKAFAVTGLPLVPGENVITARATDADGNTDEDAIRVTFTEQATAPVRLSAYPASGQAPLSVRFTADASVPEAVLYELDYDGDGVADVSAQQLSGLGEPTQVFDAEGLYFPALTVTDSAGVAHTRTVLVNVFRMPDLGKKWSNMQARLAAGDVSAATRYFALSTRDAYARQFAALAEAGALAQVAAGMTDMQVVKTMGNAAEGDLRVVRDGKEYSYYILFIRDEDGIWRIKSF